MVVPILAGSGSVCTFLRYGWIQELQKTLAMADGVKENNMTGDEKEILTTSTRADVRQGSSRKK